MGVRQNPWGCDISRERLGCRAMTDTSGRDYPSQQQYGYQPQQSQGYPDQQPWADPQQQQQQRPPQQHYGYAPAQQPPPPQQGYQYQTQQQAYPQQAYPQQQQQPYPPQQQMPQYQPGPMHTNELQCRFCGSYPAKNATIRGHRGIIVVMQFLSQKGPFCRDCGISTFRTMTSRTLVQGWWGYASFIITPITLLINLFQRLKFRDMPDPRPAPDGNSVAPMPVGKPVLLRPTVAGLLVPLAVLGFIGYAIFSGAGSAESYVGQCIKVGATADDIDFVSCDKPHDGEVISVVDNENQCSAEATGVVEQYSESRSGRKTTLNILCVK